MKSRGVLVISLIINLGLLGAWGYLAKQPSTPPQAESGGSPTKNGLKLKVQDANSISNAVAELKERFSWGLLESPDYKTYIANLRGVKCPEETVRDIIIADVDKLYALRFVALREPPEEFKFWKRNNWGRQRPVDKEKQKQMKELTKEKDALIKELLGVDAKEARAGYNWWEDQQNEQLSFLSKEKRDLLQKAKEKFQEERAEIYSKAQGHIDGDTQADLKKVHKKELVEMAQFMTPEEIENYELRTSDLSQQLKRELKLLKPSEEEFRTIFKARSNAEDVTSTDATGTDAVEARKKAAEARKDADQQMRDLLGDDRYAEYKRGNDYAYQSLAQMGDYLGFDKSAAAKVFDMKTEVEKQTRKVQSDKTLSTERRTEMLKAIRQETEKAVIEQIGEKGLKAYKRGGGYWLRNISQ
ncbi:MAG: hypothetical protein JWQ71_966 [Pedosphaera sp.]|nr:hypothetical protein [Pedosphaera sp.]